MFRTKYRLIKVTDNTIGGDEFTNPSKVRYVIEYQNWRFGRWIYYKHYHHNERSWAEERLVRLRTGTLETREEI